MLFEPTEEQSAIIKGDLVSQRVIACAGSGKTVTAVRRLLEIRTRLMNARGYACLLSYSNIAVETFRAEYQKAAAGLPDLSSRVLICTVDSFIQSNIVLPHSGRTMGALRAPFLVHGHEPFLGAFKVFNGAHNVPISSLKVQFDGAKLKYSSKIGHAPPTNIADGAAVTSIEKLGKSGAFTHETGRYWAVATLLRQQRLDHVIARRFPYILVDEAQDIGSMHGLLLQVLQEAGSVVSLVGDPNQSIFEFADADGGFLRDFEPPAGGVKLSLTLNRRSVATIVKAANLVAKSESKQFRKDPARTNGAYYLVYEKEKLADLMATYGAILDAAHYDRTDAVVLARGNPLADALRGGTDEWGQGAAELFAKSAVSRDRLGDIAASFVHALDGLLRLVQDPPPSLRRDVLVGSRQGTARRFRALTWAFLRNSETGIPSSSLNGKTTWLLALRKALPNLFKSLEADCGLSRLPTWGNNVTAAKLGDRPLWQDDLVGDGGAGLRVSTVHQAKGETIPAVMYVMKTGDLKSLISGPIDEEGRIGYVAITRAADLLLLAIPKTSSPEIRKSLESLGFAPWAGAV